MTCVRRFAFCVLSVLVAALPSTSIVHATVIDLGTLTGATGISYAYGINDDGYIVGQSSASGGLHAFMWHSGVMTDLGTIFGVGDSGAYGINEDRDYSGYSMNDSDEDYATLNMNEIRFWAGHSYYGCAYDVNNYGLTVGEISAANTVFMVQAFKYTTGGGIVSLGNPIGPSGWGSSARGVNDNGEICGTGQISISGVGYSRAFFLSSTGTATTIPTLGGLSGYGMGINSSGTVCGYSTIASSPGYRHAFIWSGGITSTDLGVLPTYNESFAYGINDSGTVVGECDGRAVMWSSSGVISDLYSEGGWRLLRATAINNNGEIVGFGYPPGKTVVHGFLRY